MAAFIQTYELLGYERCHSAEQEAGFEKIAVYESNGVPTHAARQLETGVWSSKLGNLEDVEHGLDALEGQLYGRVSTFLRKPLP
jgi:hypothetical protein